MASVADYLRQQRIAKEQDTENLIRNIGTYSRNRQALEVLGEGTPEEQDQGFKDQAKGLLSSVFTGLGAPGRLIQGGILEAIGKPSAQQRRATGLDEVKKLITGEISDVGASQLPGLKTRADDGVGTRLAKMAGAFVLDVATDPLSYVGAPSSISRKGAASLLVTTARKEGFLDDIIRKSTRGEALVDDLVAKAPTKRIAALQEEIGLEAAAGTPLDVLQQRGARAVATDQLADQLSTALFTRGRTGLLKELEQLTGSRVNALAIFKTLPDEVKGGVVLTNILGKPIKKADGTYARLTSGTLIPSLGKAAEFANAARLRTSVYPGNIATAKFGGRAGEILAGVKKSALLGPDKMAGKQASRLIDYVDVKNSLAEASSNRFRLQGRAAAAALSAAQARDSFKAGDRELFDNTFKQVFFAPAMKVDLTAASVPERMAFEEATRMRDTINGIREEAAGLGLEVRVLGDPAEWSPLVVTPEAYARWTRTGYIPDGVAQYNPERSRSSHVVFEPDEDIAKASGFRDPDNPEIVYLNAIKANDRLEQRAIEKGMSPEKAKLERVFSEDPVQVLQMYGNYMANAAATKRLVNALVATGAVVQDVPTVRRLLAEWDSAQLISGITGVSEDVQRAATARIEEIKKALAEKTGVANIDEVRARVAQARQDAITARDVARSEVARLTRELATASEEVAQATPRIARLKSQLKKYSDTMAQSAEDLAARQKASKNVNARLKTADKNLAEKLSDEELVLELYADAKGGAEQAYYREFLDQIGAATDDAAARLQREQALQASATTELQQIKAARKAASSEGASQIEQQIYAYEQAVKKRNQLVDDLKQARETRDAANSAARSAETRIGLEGVQAIDAVIQNYVDATKASAAYKLANPITKDTPEEVKASILAELKNLNQTVKTADGFLKAALSIKDAGVGSVAKEYADEVLALAKKLSSEEIVALRILTDRNKLSQYIETVRLGARDEESVMKAMGDIVTTYNSIRGQIPETAINKLTKAQELVMLNSTQAKLRDRVMREATTSSEMISALDDAGYSIVGQRLGKRRIYAESGVQKVLEQAYKTVEDPAGWNRFLSDYLDPLLLAWKTGITIGRGPGYLITNVVGGLYMNYLGNVPVSYFTTAVNATTAINKAVKRIAALNPTMSIFDVQAQAQKEVLRQLNSRKINGVGIGDLFVEFEKRGGISDSQIGAASRELANKGVTASPAVSQRGAIMSPVYQQEAGSALESAYRGGVDFLLTNKLQRMGNVAAQTSETWLRFSAFLDGFSRYDDLGAAMDKVHLLHFDYSDLSDAELWVRRLVPFYTWTRRNVPAQLRAMFMQPGKIQRFLYANEEFQNAFAADGDESWLNQVLPEYLDTQDGFVSKFKFLDNNVGAYLRLPFEDINKMFTLKSPIPLRGKELAGQLGPYTIPVELLTGVDIQTGRDLDPLGKGRAETLGNIIPQLGTAQRALSSVAGVSKAAGLDLPNIGFTQDQENKGVVTALNLIGVPALAGMSVVNVSKKGTSAELMRRIKQQSATINKAAAEKGIDVEWLRKQVRAGTPPQTIAALIAAGQGRLDTSLRAGQSSMTPEARSQALKILENL